MSTVTVTGTTPTTRKSGAALAVSDIKAINLFRNGDQIDSLVPSGPSFSFTDNSPPTGTDDYEVEVITNDGFSSGPSNVAELVIAGADPATAVSDLTATFDAGTPAPAAKRAS